MKGILMRAARLVCLASLAAMEVSTAMAQPSTSQFSTDLAQQLRERKEIHVATERKDGTRSKAVPVWFGFMDDAIWFTTGPDSHKGRRIQRGSPLFVSVSGGDGPFLRMHAEIVQDVAVAERLGALYSQKYWLAWVGFFRPSASRVQSGKVILLRVTPAP